MDSGILLAIGVYLWAAMWLTWQISPHPDIENPDTPGWISAVAYLVIFFGWPILFPLGILATSKGTHKS